MPEVYEVEVVTNEVATASTVTSSQLEVEVHLERASVAGQIPVAEAVEVTLLGPVKMPEAIPGPPGPQGDPGPPNSLSVGTVSTVSPATPASFTITGASPDQVLNLALPKGDPGGWVVSSTVAPTTDLNTVKTPGLYAVVMPGATTALNFPVANWQGWVEVMQWGAGGNNFIQRATSLQAHPGSQPYNHNAWVRSYYSGTWGPWVQIHLQGNVGGGDFTGTGSPLGVIYAPPGTYYTDTAGTNGAWRWLKKTGTGNTGWVVVHGDTGWRRFPAEDYRNGCGALGNNRLRLMDNVVYMSIDGISTPETYTTGMDALLLPAWAASPTSYPPMGYTGQQWYWGSSEGRPAIRFPSTGANTARRTGFVSWPLTTSIVWPTELLGTAG